MLELSPLLTAAKASALLDPGLEQGVAVEPDAGHRVAAERRPEPPKGGGVLVDDDDLVAGPVELDEPALIRPGRSP